jgi:hypothetical protein
MEFEKEDKVISEFLNSIGPWRNHIVIGGGYALIICKLYLADRNLENPPVGTRDIDSLIPRRVPVASKKNIAEHLHEAGFTQIFKDYNQPATEAYIKEINGLEIEIEFLTDSSTRNDKNKNVLIAGIVAQPLSYLTLSLQMTQSFTTFSGETGMIVSPGAWMFHKGLTFIKRKSASKMHKDLYGIWYAASQLGDLSQMALGELSILTCQHPKWFKTFQENIRNWLKNATPIEWFQLETQDPFGKLKRLNFEKMTKVLMQEE